MAQVVGYLCSMHETLSSTPNTTKKKKDEMPWLMYSTSFVKKLTNISFIIVIMFIYGIIVLGIKTSSTIFHMEQLGKNLSIEQQ
jgi:hypothetical protein